MKRLSLGLLVVVASCQSSAPPPIDNFSAPYLPPTSGGEADRPGHTEPPLDNLGPLEPDVVNYETQAPRAGWVQITAIDSESGQPIPSRVIISAVAPTPQIGFDIDQHGMSANGEHGVQLTRDVIGAPEGVMLQSGVGSFHMPPGTYDLFISHGPEWEAVSRRVTVVPKQGLSVIATLDRTVDTTGWMAADLHVHTGRSFDSHIGLQDRVVSEVSVGVELIVTTDHNVMTDLQPLVVDNGYEGIARAIVGNEFNFDPGHGGAYPMPYDESGKDTLGAPDGGANNLGLGWEKARFMLIAQMYDFLQRLPVPRWGPVAVTVNHPRMNGSLGFFNNLYSPRYDPGYAAGVCDDMGGGGGCGWHPPTPLAEAGKFDAIELMNGYMHNPDEMRLLLRDWFFLLSSGYRVTALGSSDTHRLRDVKAGFPRTWLRVGTDDPDQIDEKGWAVATAIKGGRAIASNGPFVTLKVNGAQIGDLVKAGKTATIEVTADAPAWIDLDKVRVFINGRVVATLDVGGARSRPRLSTRLDDVPLPTGDCWIAAQVGGQQPLPIALIGEHEGGTVMPFAITSPVYVDRDGDGAYDPRLSPRDADPGMISPVTMPMPMIQTGDVRRHTIADECEPPLWANPATWVNP